MQTKDKLVFSNTMPKLQAKMLHCIQRDFKVLCTSDM